MAMAFFLKNLFRKESGNTAGEALLGPPGEALAKGAAEALSLQPLLSSLSGLPPRPAEAGAPRPTVAGAAPFQALSPFTVAGSAGRALPPLAGAAERREASLGACGAGGEEAARVELRLRVVLRDADAARLGFAPDKVPESVLVSFSLERLASQLGAGRVEVEMEEIRQGVAEKYRPAFARAAADLRVVIPLSEVFPHIPESAWPALAPAAPGPPGVFPTPFAAEQEQPCGEAAPGDLVPSAGLFSRAPGSGIRLSAPLVGAGAVPRPFPKAVGAGAGRGAPLTASLAPLLPTAPSAAPRVGAALAAGDDLGAPFSASRLQAAPPPRPGSARFGSAAAADPEALPAAAGRSMAEASGVEDLSFGCVGDLSQVVLRAVLGTDQELSAQEIVDRCARLEGLRACVLLRQDASLVSAGLENAASLLANAAKTRDSLKSLAESLGLNAGGNFTLRSDQGVRSFFLEPGLCLGVWHDRPTFSGGTREKLTLIVQELARNA